MSTLTIARKEFEDAIRSRALVSMATLFAAVLAALVYYQLYVAREARLSQLWTAEAVVSSISTQMTVLVPVLGVMLGYKAIVGERESGSLQLLLTLPHTRREVVLGKFLGRSAVVVVSVVVGFVLVGIQFAAGSDLFSVSVYAVAAVKTAIIGVVFVAIAMAFSTAMRSSMTAAIGALGLTILFSFLWDLVYGIFVQFVDPIPIDPETGMGQPEPGPNWILLLKRLNPRQAFYEPSPWAIKEPTPFYLEPWFGWVIVAFWLTVPLGLAYLRFRDSDLV